MNVCIYFKNRIETEKYKDRDEKTIKNEKKGAGHFFLTAVDKREGGW